MEHFQKGLKTIVQKVFMEIYCLSVPETNTFFTSEVFNAAVELNSFLTKIWYF